MKFRITHRTHSPKRTLLAVTFLLMMGITLLTVSVSLAQDEDATAEPADSTSDMPPILQLLSLVPDAPRFSQEEMIGFSDFRVQAATREGASDFETMTDYMDAREADDPGARLLTNSLSFSGFPNAYFMLMGDADAVEIVGFDFFTIDSALSFGRPPGQVQIFQGDFDADQMDAALTQQGYVTGELDGVPYWCAEAGCDTGTVNNFEAVEPANPFGGDLGRSFPVVLLDDKIVASPNDANVELVAEVYQGEEASLADTPRYATAVAAMYDAFSEDGINDPAQLREAYFIPTMYLMGSDPAASLIFGGSPEEIEALREQLESQNTASLPLYQVAAFTNFASDEYQYAQVILVYALEADAQTAVEMIPKRIDTFDSIVMDRPIVELFEQRGAELLEPVVYTDEAAGMHAAVFTFQYAPASAEPDDMDMVQQSGLLYRLLVSFIAQRDTLWLTPMLELPE